MKIFFSSDFAQKFPEFTRYVVVARGIDNTGEHETLKEMLLKVIDQQRKEEILNDFENHPRIASWRSVFTNMGLDVDEVKPSVQSLIERIRRSDLKESELAFGYHSTIVALSNFISIKHLVPSGADDLGLVQGDFGLRLAKGKEVFVGFSSNDVERPEIGEVILADNRKVMCRRWVWQQGVHTMVSRETKNAIINIDILPPITPEEGNKIAEEIANLIQQYCGGQTQIFKLDNTHTEIEIDATPSTLEETVFDILEMRGYIQKTSDRSEVRRLLNEGTIVYQGFDPTKPSLHVGHLMSLMVFHYLQRAGNEMIFILGGGTAQVGDPSDRASGRKMITSEEVAENAKQVKAQVQGMGLVNFELLKDLNEKPAKLIDNSEWLHMDLLEFAREVTPHFSVNNMVKREDFKRRLDENENLSLFEFIYTALQGYDYWYLYEKYGCRIQMGGNDQWKNILDGMDLIRRKGHRNGRPSQPCFAMTFPLLMDQSGQKMGKTATGKTIWLAAEGECSLSPFEFYQYWVNCPDQDIERNFKLFTFLPLDEIDQVLAGHPRQAQHRLAFEVTKIVHSEDVAKKVQEDSLRAFGTSEGVPDDVPTVTLTNSEAERGKFLVDVLMQIGVKSRSEGRRLIQQGAVAINDKRVANDDLMRMITVADFQNIDGQKIVLIRFGKGKVVKVTIK